MIQNLFQRTVVINCTTELSFAECRECLCGQDWCRDTKHTKPRLLRNGPRCLTPPAKMAWRAGLAWYNLCPPFSVFDLPPRYRVIHQPRTQTSPTNLLIAVS